MVSHRLVSSMLACLFVLAMAPTVQAEDDPPAFTLHHVAEAGDWLVVDIPLAAETERMKDVRAFTITATAPDDSGGNLLVFPLELIPAGHSFPNWPFDPPIHRSLDAGESVTVKDSGHWSSSSSSGWVSYAIAVAADVPWTLDLSIDPDEGSTALGTPLVNNGTGTTVRDLEGLLDGPVAPADQIQAEGSFASAGWHHIQIEFDYLQPDGYRTYDIEIPTEHWQGTARIRGANTGFFGFAGSSGMIDMMGAFQDSAGDFRIDLTYAQASWDVEVFVYEMPGAFTLPEGWSSGYDQNEWPFWDCPVCVPAPDV